MQTLKEFDDDRMNSYSIDLNKPLKNNIACPECGKEMYDSTPMITLTSNPPRKNIHCDCGYIGFRIA